MSERNKMEETNTTTIAGISCDYIEKCIDDLRHYGKVSVQGVKDVDELLDYVEQVIGYEVGFEIKQHHVVLFEYA